MIWFCKIYLTLLVKTSESKFPSILVAYQVIVKAYIFVQYPIDAEPPFGYEILLNRVRELKGLSVI